MNKYINLSIKIENPDEFDLLSSGIYEIRCTVTNKNCSKWKKNAAVIC